MTSDAHDTANSIKRVPFLRTEIGNGQFFARLYRDGLRYDHKRKMWLIWRQHWWEPDNDGQVMRMAKVAARRRLELSTQIDSEEGQKAEASWAVRSQSRYRLKSMIALAQSEVPLADDGTGWDRDPWLLGVANGIVNLRTGHLRAGRPGDRITIHSPIIFDPTARCPRWLRFLDEVFGDKVLSEYIHRISGYCLSGSTREQCLFMLYGDGRNGKGTYVETLRSLFGDYACNLTFAAFEWNARSSIPNDVAATAGKRLVTAAETDEDAKLNTARIKSMTGDDKQSGRFLYQEKLEFYPTAKIMLSFNHKPTVSDDSFGYWDRVRLIPFTRKFEDDARDKELREKLQDEAQGILAWAVVGCMKWQRDGLGIPSAVREATEAYRRESDPLGAFLAECCEVKPGISVPVSTLSHEYEQWAEGNPEYLQLKPRQFSKRMLRQGFQRDQIGRERVRAWIGLRLQLGKGK